MRSGNTYMHIIRVDMHMPIDLGAFVNIQSFDLNCV